MSFFSYGQNHFQVQKQKKQLKKKNISVDNLILASQKLNSSLHSFDSKELQKSALELFDKILLYCGDSKKTEKIGLDSIYQSIIDTLLKKSELVDEGYVQLMKQMTNNARP